MIIISVHLCSAYPSTLGTLQCIYFWNACIHTSTHTHMHTHAHTHTILTFGSFLLRSSFGKLYVEVLFWEALCWGFVLGSFMLRCCFGMLCVEVLFWEAICWGVVLGSFMLRCCFGKRYAEVFWEALCWGVVLGSFMLRCFGKLYAEVLFWEALCWGVVLGSFMLRFCRFVQHAVACVCHQGTSSIFGKLYVEVLLWEVSCWDFVFGSFMLRHCRRRCVQHDVAHVRHQEILRCRPADGKGEWVGSVLPWNPELSEFCCLDSDEKARREN